MGALGVERGRIRTYDETGDCLATARRRQTPMVGGVCSGLRTQLARRCRRGWGACPRRARRRAGGGHDPAGQAGRGGDPHRCSSRGDHPLREERHVRRQAGTGHRERHRLHHPPGRLDRHQRPRGQAGLQGRRGAHRELPGAAAEAACGPGVGQAAGGAAEGASGEDRRRTPRTVKGSS